MFFLSVIVMDSFWVLEVKKYVNMLLKEKDS